MSEWTYRLAEISDSSLFVEWVKSNPLVDPADVHRAIGGGNPACLTLVACLDGNPVMFAPVYPTWHLACLSISPTTSADERKQALKGLLEFGCGLAVQQNIREINTLTRSSYPMSHIAARLGFERDDRELFRFTIPAKQPESSK
jgi:hypothetical protein